MTQEMWALGPVKELAGGNREARDLAGAYFPNEKARIGIGKLERRAFHVEHQVLREGLNKTVAAHWAVSDGNAVQRNKSVFGQAATGSVEQILRDLAGTEFRETAPVQDVGFAGFSVSANENDGCRLAIDVADEGVGVGEIPISLKRQEGEEIEMVLDRGALGRFIQQTYGVRNRLKADRTQVIGRHDKGMIQQGSEAQRGCRR